jgi:hypothetical protein
VDFNYLLAIALILTLVAALTMPLFRFLVTGWEAKRKDIVDGMSNDACYRYFKMFCRAEELSSDDGASQRFRKVYETWYGREFFRVPVLLILCVSLTAATIVVFTILEKMHFMKNPLFNLPVPALAALAGAYMWVMNDLISRARRLDLAPSDVEMQVLRLIVSIPMGYAFAYIAPKYGPFIAFSLGAFPFVTLTGMLRRVTNKLLNIEPKDHEVVDGIVKLQGTDRAIVERLANEGITTITQIAYCDPVRITMRSSLSFNLVTDLMNQALVWLYLKEDLEKIRPLSLRGAVEVKHLVDELTDVRDPAMRTAAQNEATKAFLVIAAAIKQDPAALLLTFRQIAEDPYSVFLYEIWTGADDAGGTPTLSSNATSELAMRH